MSDPYAIRARDTIGRRLLAAAYREDIAGIRSEDKPSDSFGSSDRGGSDSHPTTSVAGHTAIRHAFGQVAITDRVTLDPAILLAAMGTGSDALTGELDDAVTNLAIAYARRDEIAAQWRGQAVNLGEPDTYGVAAALAAADPDAAAVALERLSTDGHNLHPCGRTRLGWTEADVRAHDQESAATAIEFVAVRGDAHLGDDVGALLTARYDGIPEAPDGYVVQPVHTWQLHHVLRTRHASAYRDGLLRDIPGPYLVAAPTTALRTVLLPADRVGRRCYLKVSLDIQVTSSRRSISVASTRNGPQISRLLPALAGDPRVLFMSEIAGAAWTPGRDAAAIVREGLNGRLGPGELPVPGSALPALSPVTGRTILAEIVDRYAVTRAIPARPDAAARFIGEYARLLLPPVLRLLHHGLGLEAHLQNSIPVFRDGVPVRIAFRDFAGLRLHLPRIRVAAPRLDLWPGSVIGTEDADVARSKAGYTVFQAHLGELIARLTESHGLDERAAWRGARDVVDEVYDGMGLGSDAFDAGDYAFTTAPEMPHKALVRMRLEDTGDIYVPVPNPLYEEGHPRGTGRG